MKEAIKQLCQDIEREHNISILFAVENGSRAWGIDSKDSDYDVRFVFVSPIEKYLKVNPALDEVVNAYYNNDLRPCSAKGAFMDMSGFGVFKYAKLLSQSNPTAIEWAVSDIIHAGQKNEVFRDFAIKEFNPIALFYHYKSLCKNNYLLFLKSESNSKLKKLLYAYRGLVNAKWVFEQKTVPPISLQPTIEALSLPTEISIRIKKLIELKRQSNENGAVLPEKDIYIETFMNETIQPEERHKPQLGKLDEELRRILLKN